MAGMFYSLKETADRLGKTEDEVRQLARGGKLREFRDGSHTLFKVDEVNALVAEGIDIDLDAEPAIPAEPAEVLEAEPATTPEGASEDDVLNLLEEEPTATEPAAEAEASSEMELAAEPEAEASSEMELVAEPEAEASSELDLAAESGAEATSEEDELFFLEEDEKPAESGAETAAETDEEIALAAESGAPAESDITNMDTALTGEGIPVLGETDTEYEVTEDSMAETVGPAASAGATGTGTGSDAEASLEEVEDELNLDSFGSGSGLLDLSLQADDTSLGGILDEIYTADGGEEGPAAGAEPGSVEDITAEAEQVAPDEELGAPEAAVAAPVAAAAYPAYAEAAPDTQSNILGMLLILPLLALLYTAIVAISGQRHVVPSILSSIQGMIWYIIGGLIVLSLLISGASFVMGGERTKTAAPRKAKEVKVKAAKAEKPRKEKPAAEKPAKEKKGFSLFGKKKEKK